MCSSLSVPPKTLCRVFGCLSVLLGLLSLYYWHILLSFGDKVRRMPGWSSVLYLNDKKMTTTISNNCGTDHLEKVTPQKFGNEFINVIALFMASSIICCLQGFVEFFMTCADPKMARSICFGVILTNILSTGILCIGLYYLQSSNLCLLEHTDIMFYPGQQSLLTLVISVGAGLLKGPEIISLCLFVCEQNIQIASGETRSKGSRRSEAFITPMSSRVNSFLGGKRGGDGDSTMPNSKRGYNRGFRVKNANLHFFNLQQINSDEEEDENLNENVKNLQKKVSFGMDNELEEGGFVEIDLNEEQETTQNEMDLDASIRNENFGLSGQTDRFLGYSTKSKECEQSRNNATRDGDDDNNEKEKLLN